MFSLKKNNYEKKKNDLQVRIYPSGKLVTTNVFLYWKSSLLK